ncbi:MAG: type II toxin-antitoxin system VapC family toxin [Myxococcota bacterium]|jgi:predicted nucleic acid-binding protein
MRTVVDSCGWIEYFLDGPRAGKYVNLLEGKDKVVVPTIVFCEVYKKIKRSAGEDKAMLAAAMMKKHELVPLSEELALAAGDQGLLHSLPLADSIVYATALALGARVMTSDGHFKGLSGVEFIE